jgi:2,3-diketo-5-methylthio-1-phosphopentane phosphatase
MLPRFSRGDLWRKLEKKWERGEIGSQACLEGQLRGMSITRESLDEYLAGIKLDPYFRKLVKLFHSQGIKTVVLSDNFDYILKRILKRHAIKKLKLYCNKLRFAGGRLIPVFPFSDKHCQLCAHCKTKNLLLNIKSDSIIIYIGDGRSDICPAQYADIVFAKAALLKHYKDKGLSCISYRDLKDAYNYFKRSLL